MIKHRPVAIASDEIIVVGTGMAGLTAALSLAPLPVTLITKTPRLESGSSQWAKGGIAAAIGPEDSPEAHAEATLSTGTGIGDLRRLLERVRKAPSIQILRNTFAHELLVHEGSVRGVLTFEPNRGWTAHYAAQVVLATGGIGMAWWHTTNPSESTGDGLAMAARAGAELSDLESMQFHPTALGADTRSEGSSPPLPSVPAAHYHMGGIQVDDNGRTSLGGLWACGEVANTGVHGANRLASNSLLDAVVYARRVADGIRQHQPETNEFLEPSVEAPKIPASDAGHKLDGIRAVARETMSRCVGIVRSRDGMQQALAALGTLENRIEGLCGKGHRRESPGFDLVMSWGEARNQLLVSRLVTLAALDRLETPAMPVSVIPD